MPKQDSTHRHRRPRDNKKFSGLLLILATVILIGIFAFFYIQKINNREQIANYLPADRAIALFEYNLDPTSNKTQVLKSLASQNPVIQNQLDNLLTYIPHQDVFQKWYTDRGGVAVLSSANKQDFQLVLFLQQKDTSAVRDWISELVLDPKNDAVIDEDIYGQKLISFRSGQNYNMLLSGRYLAVAEDKDLLKEIAKAASGNTLSLHLMPEYNQASSALPDQNIFFFYLDRQKLLSVLSKNDNYLSGRLAALKLYFPFLKLFSSEAVAVDLDYTNDKRPQLVAKHLSLFNQSLLNNKQLFQTDYFYNSSLGNFQEENPIFIMGGANLEDQKNKLQEYFGNQSSLNEILVEGLVENLSGQVGNKVDLNQDFFPLIKKSYLLTLSAPLKQLAFSLIVESENAQNDLLQWQKLLLPIGTKIASNVEAKAQAITLPDGTVGKELKADLPEPTVESTNISGQAVNLINFSPKLQIYLLADSAKNRIVISSTRSFIENYLQNKAESKAAYDFGLDKPSEVYRLNINNLASVFPEIIVLKPLQEVSVARKFTELGVLSTYQLEF